MKKRRAFVGGFASDVRALKKLWNCREFESGG
jgi:hypothetical protein